MREHLELLYYFPLVLEIYSPVGNNLVIHLFFQSAFWGRGLLLRFSCVLPWWNYPIPCSGHRLHFSWFSVCLFSLVAFCFLFVGQSKYGHVRTSGLQL